MCLISMGLGVIIQDGECPPLDTHILNVIPISLIINIHTLNLGPALPTKCHMVTLQGVQTSYGPYHESNAAAYHHNPYGYSTGAHQGQPPPNTHATPDVGLGANVPAPGVVRNPTLGGRHAQEPRMEDGPVKEG